MSHSKELSRVRGLNILAIFKIGRERIPHPHQRNDYPHSTIVFDFRYVATASYIPPEKAHGCTIGEQRRSGDRTR